MAQARGLALRDKPSPVIIARGSARTQSCPRPTPRHYAPESHPGQSPCAISSREPAPDCLDSGPVSTWAKARHRRAEGRRAVDPIPGAGHRPAPAISPETTTHRDSNLPPVRRSSTSPSPRLSAVRRRPGQTATITTTADHPARRQAAFLCQCRGAARGGWPQARGEDQTCGRRLRPLRFASPAAGWVSRAAQRRDS